MAIIGVTATVVVALMVVITLLLTGGREAVSDNATLIGALIALGGVFTTQIVNSALEAQRAQQARNTEQVQRERDREAEQAQRERDREAERAQRERDREAEQAQRERELEVGAQRAQDDALQAYLDQMSRLLIDKGLHRTTHWLDDFRVTARAQSLAVLQRLDGARKKSVLRFLYEARLINEAENLGPDDQTLSARIVGLSGADLREANLRYITLEGAALNGAILENAHLKGADLRGIDLGGAYLSGADLSGADLSEASLQNAQLQPHDELNLSGTNLSGTDLSGTDLRGANLNGTNLYEAKGWTEEQLTAAWSLEGATMPNGQKYEAWIKDKKARGKDEKNE
jgi:uncharacterized protein YjbI with pentapeptide repeats